MAQTKFSMHVACISLLVAIAVLGTVPQVAADCAADTAAVWADTAHQGAMDFFVDQNLACNSNTEVCDPFTFACVVRNCRACTANFNRTCLALPLPTRICEVTVKGDVAQPPAPFPGIGLIAQFLMCTPESCTSVADIKSNEARLVQYVAQRLEDEGIDILTNIRAPDPTADHPQHCRAGNPWIPLVNDTSAFCNETATVAPTTTREFTTTLPPSNATCAPIPEPDCPICNCSLSVCSHSKLECQNEGILPSCSPTIPCSKRMDEAIMMGTTRCTCFPGYQGSECQFFDAQLYDNNVYQCPKGTVLDASFLNYNETRNFECKVKFNSQTETLGLRDHRGYMAVDVSRGEANISLVGRYPNDDNTRCTRILTLLECFLTDCEPVTIDGGIEYQCATKDCHACREPECDVLVEPRTLREIVASWMTQPGGVPVTMLQDPKKNGTAHAVFPLTTQAFTFEVPLTCVTGECVRSLSSSAPPPKLDDAASELAFRFAAGGLLVACTVWATALALASCHARRRDALLKVGGGVELGEVHGKNDRKVPGASAMEGELGGHHRAATLNGDKAASPRGRADPTDRAQWPLVAGGSEGEVGAFDEEALDDALTRSTVRILWRNMTYNINGTQVIRDPGMTGLATSGELVALLGQAGCGKTTLLELLAGLPKPGTIRGQVRVFAEFDRQVKELVPSARSRRPLVGYVPAGAPCLPTLTVYERLLFALRITSLKAGDMGASDAEIHHRLMHTLKLVELDKKTTRRISELSSGETKRVLVAEQLLQHARVIVLDEPTSGLDAEGAENLIHTLKHVAQVRHVPVILSIHQPAVEVWNQFDQVLFLAPGGVVTFHGPRAAAEAMLPAQRVLSGATTGAAAAAASTASDSLLGGPIGSALSPATSPLPPGATLRARPNGEPGLLPRTNGDHSSPMHSRAQSLVSQGHGSAASVAPMFPVARNPATDLLKQSTADPAALDRTLQAYHASGTYREMFDAIRMYEQKLDSDPNSSGSQSGSLSGVHQSGSQGGDAAGGGSPSSNEQTPRLAPLAWFAGVRLLVGRGFKHISRFESAMALQYLGQVSVAIAVGVAFSDTGVNSVAGLQNRLGVLLFAVLYFSLTSMSALGVFISEREVFIREVHVQNWYSPLQYLIAKAMTELLPMRFLPAMLFGIIVYLLAGLRTDDGGMYMIRFLILLALVSVTAASVCMAFGAVAGTLRTATSYTVLFMMFNLIFSGLILNTESGPTGFLKLFSFMNYGYQGLVANELEGKDFSFEDSSLEDDTVKVSGKLVLDNLALKPSSIEAMIAWLSIYCVSALGITYLALRFLHKRTSR